MEKRSLDTKFSAEPLHVDTVIEQFKFLQGKILTIIEASVPNDRQLKAVKDITNRTFSEQMSIITSFAYPDLPIYSREHVAEMGVDVDKVESEAECICTKTHTGACEEPKIG